MNVKITYEKRDISVPKKVAEFLEADRRRIETQGRSDRRHLSKGELEPMLDRYVTGSYNTEEAALRNLTLKNLRSAIANLDTDEKRLIKYKYYEEFTHRQIGDIFKVSKMAITKRLKKLHTKLRDSMIA
ncbi:MAG: sigma-70 family RNA polymerase sigma factor [Marinifilaceae bacterium]|jgi:RNA polymerase sigma factor (sigma-70 family)|nr:sigma-70 family RNA polymerase sigma factor [Marinifilaceae bacterium]